MGFESSRLRFKAISMLLRYYARAFSRRAFVLFPLLLFFISLGLFVLALVSSARTHLRNSTLLATAPLSLEVQGTVLAAAADGSPKGLSGVNVEAGGFRTTTSVMGDYRLRFDALTTQNLPVVFSYQGRENLRRVSFPPGSMIARYDLVLP